MAHDIESGDDLQDGDLADGLHLLHREATADHPSWSHTAGLWRAFQHPEVVVFGLAVEQADELLHAVMDLIEDGGRFEAGRDYDDVLVGMPIRFGRVSEAQARVLFPDLALAYGSAEVPMVQLIYPDKHGRWPWQPGVREGFRALQPVLERHRGAGEFA